MVNSPHAVQDNRAQGNGSGSSHRPSGTPHMVKFIAFFHFKRKWLHK